jgi:hypothetical protein
VDKLQPNHITPMSSKPKGGKKKKSGSKKTKKPEEKPKPEVPTTTEVPKLDVQKVEKQENVEVSGGYMKTKSGTILSKVSSRYKNSEMTKNKKWHVNQLGEVIFKNHERFEIFFLKKSFGLMKQIQMGLKSVVKEKKI